MELHNQHGARLSKHGWKWLQLAHCCNNNATVFHFLPSKNAISSGQHRHDEKSLIYLGRGSYKKGLEE